MLCPVLLDPMAQLSSVDPDLLRDFDDRSIRCEEELDGDFLELLGVLLPAGGHDGECSLEPVSLHPPAAQVDALTVDHLDRLSTEARISTDGGFVPIGTRRAG